MSELFTRVKATPTPEVVRAFFPGLELKRDGGGREKALCPFHQENTPSFTVFEDGWKCFGCGAHGSNVDLLLKAGLASSPLEAAKMIAERFGIEFEQKRPREQKPLALSEYATYTKLPQDFLTKTFHLEETAKGIAFPYRDESRNTVGVQMRHRLEKGKGKDARFSWKEGKPYLYGAWGVARWKEKGLGSALLCEGASDVQVCWYNQVAALGIPGANNFKNEWANLLLPFAEVSIIQEPGEAGAKFAKSICAALKEADYRGQVKAVSLSDKDPRDLWLKHGERFKEELEAAISRAPAIDLYPPIPLTADLIHRVADLLRRHVFFKDERIPLLIATWVLGTYLYDVFTYFGYLWLNSPVKRCGKSLLEDILASLCFQATSRVSNLTESVVFHLAHKGKTLIVDELESMRKQDKEKYGAVMSVLNTGFQAGGKVYRMRRSESGFEDQEFNVFCPKVLAGISQLTDTIEDRSFKIAMVRKTASERVDRFSLRKQGAELEKLRADLASWAEASRGDIEKIYDGLEAVPGLESVVDDRFHDISEPLAAIACLADAEATNGSVRIWPELRLALLDLAGKRAEVEQEEAIASFAQLAIELLGDREEMFIPTTRLFEESREVAGLSRIESARGLGKFLSRFDFTSTKRPVEGKQARGFVLKRERVMELVERYCPPSPGSQTSQTSRSRAQSGSEPLFANVPEGAEGHHENEPQTRMGVRRGT